MWSKFREVRNFSCPKIIRTLNPLNLLLFTFQIFICINQEKLIKHAPKKFQTLHFKLYVVLKRGSTKPFPRYSFSISGIIGFDDFKCIPCYWFSTISYQILAYSMKKPKLERMVDGKTN
jgi:hypothetical protein